MALSAKRIGMAIGAVALAAAVGCTPASGESARPEPTAAERAPEAEAASRVARIVFIDQEQACECTRTRIEGSWTALQGALRQGSAIPVERVHRDTQEELAEEYRALRPIVTVPGIYLLDARGRLVALLQGEVTESQVRAALGDRS